jgi:iron(III) transport system substrate-binding protein
MTGQGTLITILCLVLAGRMIRLHRAVGANGVSEPHGAAQRMWRRLVLFRLFVGCFGIALAACTAPASPPSPAASQVGAAARAAADDPPALAQLYDAARREGEVVFEGAQKAEDMQPVIDGFAAKYPGVQVSYANRTPGETVERIVAEAAAGRGTIDVSSSPLGTVLPLVDRNLATTVDWKSLVGNLPDEAPVLRGQVVTWYHLPSVVAYNTNLVSQADVPRKWEDLLAPRWRGRKMVLDARGVTLFPLPFVWGEQQAFDFIGKLKGQEPILVPRMAVATERVAAGEAPFGTTTLADVFQYREKGASMSWAPLSPVMVSVNALFVVERSPHPNAAKLWSAFLLSEEGRQLFEDATFQAMVFPGTNTRLERALREANVELWFEDTDAKARQRAEFQPTMERLLGGLR